MYLNERATVKDARFNRSSTITKVTRIRNVRLTAITKFDFIIKFISVCYLGYGSAAKLVSSAIKKVISVTSEVECKNECIRYRETSAFKCLSFSYGYATAIIFLSWKPNRQLTQFQVTSQHIQLRNVRSGSERIKDGRSLYAHAEPRLLAVRVESIWLHLSRQDHHDQRQSNQQRSTNGHFPWLR